MRSEAPIEIVVLTYNRAHFLGETLRSIVSQSVRPCRIRVLDNGSTDGTSDVVRAHALAGVEFVRWKDNDPRGCWARMQAMVEAPWTMLFHDDDLLHPDCIRCVHDAILRSEDTSIILTLMQSFIGAVPPFPELRLRSTMRLSSRQLAERLYRGLAVPFCTAVYRKDALKGCEAKVTTYGKIFDRPFLLDAAAVSGATLIRELLVLYRRHPSQDSSHRSSGPFPTEVIALQSFYRRLLGENPLQSEGRAFLRRNWRNLVDEHARMRECSGWDLSLESFMAEAIRASGASRRSFMVGRAYAGITSLPRRLERAVRGLRRSRSRN